MTPSHLSTRLRTIGKHDAAERLERLADGWWEGAVTMGQYCAEHARAWRVFKRGAGE